MPVFPFLVYELVRYETKGNVCTLLIPLYIVFVVEKNHPLLLFVVVVVLHS